ncbi:hypothetical protein [Archangium sp.]|uniref:hypothetical protein n=1 Tax=Archangium sp. TaxID=1872627 RepID=UPI003899B697
MARYDKDSDIQINPTTTTPDTHIDKRKGSMSVRDAAALEISQQEVETSMRGTPVHGFGNGTGTEKRHTGTGMPMGMMNLDMPQQGMDESMTRIIDQLFQLPFQAQLSVMRMMASRVLGAMDARDQEMFLKELRMELDKMAGEDTPVAGPMNEPDIQGT